MKLKLIIVLSLVLNNLMYSQNSDCNCCTEPYKQFDFWLGEWDVFDLKENKLGENTVVKLQDNCVLQENWISESLTGTSYNYYNASDSTWNQVWIDNNGYSLILKGNYSDGKMILRSKLLKGEKIDWYYNQITWKLTEEKDVIQTWDTFDKAENLITTVFIGIYKKKILNP